MNSINKSGLKVSLLLAFAFIFAISCATIGSAWTSSEFTLDSAKQLEKNSLTTYGKYEITEHQWWDIAKIFTEEKVKEVTLKENTDECSDNCLAIKEVTNLKPMPLIDDVRFYREIDGKWVLWNGFTNWKIEVEEDVDLFETQCIQGKEIIDEKNGTSYFEQECSQVKTGTEKQWLPLDYKKDYEGTYRVKLSGGKKASVKYDWQVKMNGVWSENWAVWGAVIGVGGVEASVTLNSPDNNSIQYTNLVTLNASANVTGGAYLVNATLYDNSTGSWGARNTSILALSGNITDTREFGSDIYVTPLTNIVGFYNFTTPVKLTSVGNWIKGNGVGGAQSRILFYYQNGTNIWAPSGVNETSSTSYTFVTVNNPLPNSLVRAIGYGLGDTAGESYANSKNYTMYNITEGLYASTATFTNTYAVGSNIKWNYQFCDTDGDCGFAVSNYTFSIDSTAPTIALNYPTSLIDYGKMNGSLQLNFTATDTNLDKVWYNYNGTNVSVTGALSGIENLSNITLSTKKNVTIYANDTAGNLETTTFSWDYKVFENSRNYVNSTYSRVSNNFVINITSLNATTILLNYNGINYSTNTYSSGSNVISSVSVLSPIVTQDTNITFYWLVTLSDGSVVQTTSNNQSIIYLTIGNTYSNLIYNITLRNENTNALIPNNNVTMSYEIDYGFDINSILGTANFNDNKLLNKNISSNIFSQLYLAGDIIFSAPDFIGRNYYFVENSIIDPKNVTLYLSYENESYVKSIIVTDEGGRGVPALYEQYRNINGVDVLIASENLDSTGKSNIVFTPNVQYIFKFYTDTCLNATKNIIFYDQTDYTQVLSCSSYNPDDWVDEFKDMQVSFSPNGLFYVDNDTEDDDSAFFANVSGSSALCNSINTIVFNIYNSTGALIGSDTASGCDVLSDSAYFDLFARATLYILLDSGEEKTLGFRWQKLYSNKDYSGYNILDLLQEVGESEDILGIDWKFKLLFCFIGLFGIIIALTAYQRIYNFSNTATLIICDAYLWFMCFIGWGSLDFGKVGGGFTTLISQYALFILAVIGTVGVLSNKEDEYS